MSISLPRPHVTRRETRTNFPDSSPLHHNEGTSYFQSRPISPSLNRRMHGTSAAAGPSLTRPPVPSNPRHSQGRSVSVSSVRPRYQETVVSEEDEDEEAPRRRRNVTPAVDGDGSSSSDDEEGEATRVLEREEALSESGSLDPVTLKERQSLINVEHPFGLPIWKPALYKKSRTVTRDAEHALHNIPSATAERHLHPGNVFWALLFGWWMALICFLVATILYCVPRGGSRFGRLIRGLGWYLFWPFGKYLEGDIEDPSDEEGPKDEDDEADNGHVSPIPEETSNLVEESEFAGGTVKGSKTPPHVPTGVLLSEQSTITPQTFSLRPETERAPLLSSNGSPGVARSTKTYGLELPRNEVDRVEAHMLCTIIYYLFFISIIAPVMLVVALVCYALVFTIPMARLNKELLKYLFYHPLRVRFREAPPPTVQPPPPESPLNSATPTFTVKQPRLRAGQIAPFGKPTSKVLLCTYRAVGLQYYKYTVGGVNIMFVNLLPVVFFVIFDFFVLVPIRRRSENSGQPINRFFLFLTSGPLLFSLSLASVIPLSYFIGMAVASISAQSSIGMGAVINATFGSIIEIILYSRMLLAGKGRIVEGCIVGSLLAGVLLMPGTSMCSGAMRTKEQKFNAKSAGVTSTMLIMAIIGTLTPTLFYQTFGEFTLVCDGCPPLSGDGSPWHCRKCYYEHLDPASDPFYQTTVRSLMYLCASVLLLSYLIGLWFSLRTHASQIWQNPQQLMQPLDALASSITNPASRMSMYKQLSQVLPIHRPLNRQTSNVTMTGPPPPVNQHQRGRGTSQQPSASDQSSQTGSGRTTPVPASLESPTITRRPTAVASSTPVGQTPRSPGPLAYTPLINSVNLAVRDANIAPMQLPPNLTTDDFTRAVAVATVSALRHQQDHPKVRGHDEPGGQGGHGGHDAPAWSRFVSASVLLGCTVLYAIIAEILVDTIDVLLVGYGLDEKFLGITLLALVPNTTEFMNAISFALNDNITLSMEIGSAYALQVCLLQIPAMVAFSAWSDPALSSIADTFTLIFPRWDVIAIILSIFLLTYTYIEAKANYYRGSILVLSYVVLVAGFYFAPPRTNDEDLTLLHRNFMPPSGLWGYIQTLYFSIWSS
ncbi:uncharacterized protein EI90DRAFT_2916517 [Cantharellus anzutake]|uniref:uncharacterized protein n=1 Tax=Cantharellus anzutake TaxID=1750568 RepID=UPI00190490E3|nr:uncharacterized protein EI90DRAFT_2916517 [Cantharellus anzutake]KAF8333518.1 hypothetical protein EI90DRAFT_2916517 [Cantharellus anzutake]